jgi:Tol biopolymer transport system component
MTCAELLGRRRSMRWLGIALTLLGSPLVSLLVGTADAHAEYPGPNGQIAFGRLDRAIDAHHVFTADPDGTDETQLLPGDAENPFWSPDGSRVLVTRFRADGALRPATLNPDGSGFTLLDNPAPMDIGCSAWSPDGTRLLCQGSSVQHPELNGLYTLRASDGGGLVRLTDNPFDQSDIAGDYSPDGARIAFTRQRQGRRGPKGAVFVANADGTALRQITPFGLPDHDEVAKWSPDGTGILFGSVTEKLLVVRPDGTRIRKISPRTLGRAGIKKLERKLLKRCRKSSGQVERCRRKAAKRARTKTTGIGFDPGWSPDGKRIVFSLRFRPGGRVDIYTARSDGTHLVQITDTPVFETFSDWGPHPVAP